MVTQTAFHRKLTGSDLTAYALKAAFSSLDLLGNRLLLQRSLRTSKNIIPEVPYGDHPKQRMDIVSLDRERPYPILVYFHGGGFIVGDKAGYRGVCNGFVQHGYLTFNVNYRLAPRYRCHMQLADVASALAWIYHHAGDYGGDRRRIFLAGDSAGALHVSWYASALGKIDLLKSLGIDCVIPREALKGLLLFYGVYDLETVLNSGFPFIKTFVKSFLGDRKRPFREQARLWSPMRHVVANMPPTFICAGERDGLFGQSAQYAEALENKGVNTSTLFFSASAYPDATHGFLYFPTRTCTQTAFREAARFMAHMTDSRQKNGSLRYLDRST